MLNCPYCRQPAMRLWRKCILGPEAALACRACGSLVGVPWAAALAAVPLAVALIGIIRLPWPWSLVAGLAGVVTYVAVQRFVVPLEGRQA